MYKIAICDDHRITIDHVSEFIMKSFKEQCRVFTFTTPKELEHYVNIVLKGDLDILIIDIDLITDNGIRVAERLKANFPHLRVIFISGQIQFVRNIFEIRPIYFVEKPMEDAKLLSAVSLAIQDIEQNTRNTVSITAKGVLLQLDINNLMFLESKKRSVALHEGHNERDCYIKLDIIEKNLPKKFCRCHHSYIVNFDYASELKMYQFTLFNGVNIPISQRRYKEVKRLFSNYLGGSL